MNEQDFMINFACAIAERREEYDMTQKEFAAFIGVSVNTLQNYESGRYLPTLYTAILIANKLGTSLDVLVGYA